MIRQIRSVDGTGTLSYLVVDRETRSGIVVDPNMEDIEQIRSLVEDLGLTIRFVVDTHTHADHVSGAGELRKMLQAQTVMHANTVHKGNVIHEGDRFGIGDILRANARIPVDLFVHDGDVLAAGSLRLDVVFTPGHTDNHIALTWGTNIFTGDLLLIGQAGRSDLPGGDPEELFESLFTKIIPLPDSTRIFPGHDYSGAESSLLGDERRNNPFLFPRTKAEFVIFAREFFPPLSEHTSSGSKVTLQCGAQRVVRAGERIRSITASELFALRQSGRPPFLLDVREPAELATAGAIEGVYNVPLGALKTRMQELPVDKTEAIVCVCQSGSRSMEAVYYLQQQGYENVLNLSGGTGGWIMSGLPCVLPATVSSTVRTLSRPTPSKFS